MQVASAPKKSVVQICSLLEEKLEEFDAKGIDYLNYIADKVSSNLGSDQANYFLSENFKSLVISINNFRQVKKVMEIKLDDFLRNQVQEKVDLVAQTLLTLWPYMHKFAAHESKPEEKSKDRGQVKQENEKVSNFVEDELNKKDVIVFDH